MGEGAALFCPQTELGQGVSGALLRGEAAKALKPLALHHQRLAEECGASRARGIARGGRGRSHNRQNKLINAWGIETTQHGGHQRERGDRSEEGPDQLSS